MYERDLAAGRVDGSLVAYQVGGLSRFTITDVLALHLLDEAAGPDLFRSAPPRSDYWTRHARFQSVFPASRLNHYRVRHVSIVTVMRLRVCARPRVLNSPTDRWIHDEPTKRVDQGHVERREASYRFHVDSQIEHVTFWTTPEGKG